jgi:hypothetical protein
VIPLAIDPGVATFPEETAADFENRISVLLFWSALVRQFRPSAILLPRSAVLRLAEANCFPAFNSIQESLSRTELGHKYSANDISVQVNTVLGCGALEDFIRPDDVSWADWSLEGMDKTSNENEHVQREVQRILTSLAVNANCEEPPFVNFGSWQQSKSLKITSTIDMVVPDHLHGFRPIDLPRNIEASISHISNFEEFCDAHEPELLWRRADSAELLKFAIQLDCRLKLKTVDGYKGFESIPKFRIGSGFFSSLRSNQSLDGKFASATLDRCSRVILGLESRLKKFTVSSDADSAQRVRQTDGALAFRVHISKEHEAMRLLVWKKNTGDYEFANVGPKNEMIIEEGVPEIAT